MIRQELIYVIVAHPDDETLYFGGFIQKNAHKVHVICLTNGNADGQGAKRKLQFENACKLLGVQKTYWLGFEDIFDQPVDEVLLYEKLNKLPCADIIYTHGPYGEYGHPHHRQCCIFVHRYYEGKAIVNAVSYNSFPDEIIELNKMEFELKKQILTDVYGSETGRFIHLLPITSTESFKKWTVDEVEEINLKILKGNSNDFIADVYHRYKQRPF